MEKKHLILSLLLSTSCGSLVQPSTPPSSSFKSDTAEYPALLSNGYDSLRLENKYRACIHGRVISSPQIEASVDFNRVDNWMSLLSQMNFSIPGAVYLNSSSELAKFALKARDSFLSSTYILNNEVTIRREILADPEITYSAKDAKKFHEECGNQYVSVVEYGGKMNVGVKFSFSDSYYKEEFDASAAVKSISGLGSKVKTLSTDVKKHSSVEIFFHQVGGDLNEVNSIFESGDIIACSLDQFQKCESLLEDVWKYSTDRFIKAVQNGKDQPIGFKTVDYPNREKIHEHTEVRKERRKILDMLEQHLSDYDLIHIIQSRQDSFANCDSRCAQKMMNLLASNIRSLKDSITLSFNDAQEFINHRTLEQLDLYPYILPDKNKDYHSWLRKNMRYAGSAVFAMILAPILYKYWNWSGASAVATPTDVPAVAPAVTPVVENPIEKQ